LLAVVVVSTLAFFDVKWSVRVLAPFLALEVCSLLVLDIAIVAQGGAQGQDFYHTFTTAGSSLHGVFPGGLLGIGVGMALGVWSCLVPVLYLTISTSTFAAILAFHNGMVRYFYSLGRETVLPPWFGKTHPRWHSPYTASLVQSAFSIVVILFLAMIFQKTNAD